MGAAKHLWNNFVSMTDITYVIRQGYVACGVYQQNRTIPPAHSIGNPNLSTDVEVLLRQESTAEHSARVANLLSEFILWYPLFFQDIDAFMALKVALNHDIGEAVVGDVLDDGTIAHEFKKPREWLAVKEFYGNLPPDMIELALDYHRQFDESNTRLGQMIRMADKVDAVGRLILYEKMGMRGDIYHKNPPSERDEIFAKEIHTGNCTDVWARHLKWLFEKEDFRPQVITVAKDFLAAGLASIGREFFTWW